jgi:hypothetical protein
MTAGEGGRRSSHWREGALVLCALIACMLWAKWLQGRDMGANWDGSHYARMTAHLARGLSTPLGEDSVLTAAFPYRNRVGLPLLAAGVARLTGWDYVQSLRRFNIVVAIATLFVFWLWLCEVLPQRSYRLLAVLLWAVHWHGPIRYVAWYPTITDQLMLCALCGALLGFALLQRGRWAAWVVLPVAIGAAVLTREIGIVLLAGFVPLVRLPRAWGVGALSAAAVLLSVAVILWLTARSPAEALAEYRAYQHGAAPAELWTRALHFAVAFGPILLCIFAAPRAVLVQWRTHAYIPMVLLAAAPLWMPWRSGEERYITWLAPLIYPGIAAALADLRLSHYRAWVLALFLILSQSVAARVWWAIPTCCEDEQTVLPVEGLRCPVTDASVVARPIRFLLTPWSGRCSMWEDVGVCFTQEPVRVLLWEQYVVLTAILACLFAIYWYRRLTAASADAKNA